MSENVLVGKRLTAAFIAQDKMALRFDPEGEEPIVVRVDADCCSHTWIESIEGGDALVGATVLTVEDIDMPDDMKNEDGDYIAFYGLRIVTEKGHCIIDYRNESNGYYGGNLSWPGDEYDYFYGGVYGQNVSAMEWESIR